MGRLCELVTSLDPHGVEVVDGTAHRDGSAARDLGEWATIWLASPDDLATPGAWAALQDARNVAVTGEVPSHPGLTRLAYPA